LVTCSTVCPGQDVLLMHTPGPFAQARAQVVLCVCVCVCLCVCVCAYMCDFVSINTHYKTVASGTQACQHTRTPEAIRKSIFQQSKEMLCAAESRKKHPREPKGNPWALCMINDSNLHMAHSMQLHLPSDRVSSLPALTLYFSRHCLLVLPPTLLLMRSQCRSEGSWIPA
jgi:hypothetical protein